MFFILDHKHSHGKKRSRSRSLLLEKGFVMMIMITNFILHYLFDFFSQQRIIYKTKGTIGIYLTEIYLISLIYLLVAHSTFSLVTSSNFHTICNFLRSIVWCQNKSGNSCGTRLKLQTSSQSLIFEGYFARNLQFFQS